MRKITEEDAIGLLRKYSGSDKLFEKVLNHVKAEQRVALRIASKCKNVDMYKIRIGSLLHDIGRFSCPPSKDKVRHGLVGAEILKKEGLDDIANIAERHVGVGIRKEDISKQGLDLPNRDFVPETKEEKIITHADNLIFDDKEGSFEDVITRFRNELGESFVERVKSLKKEIDEMERE